MSGRILAPGSHGVNVGVLDLSRLGERDFEKAHERLTPRLDPARNERVSPVRHHHYVTRLDVRRGMLD